MFVLWMDDMGDKFVFFVIYFGNIGSDVYWLLFMGIKWLSFLIYVIELYNLLNFED